ncbi:MAG: hypothetical protein RL235_272, partial [Chlamydiota bacterium]
MDVLRELNTWFLKHEAEAKNDYFAFLRFASVSADPAYADDVRRCASWVQHFLQKKQGKAELIETKGYPLVFMETPTSKPNAKTVLIYGHYDVQPVDPIDLWTSPPFEPTERAGKIFARGALDDKGQIFYAMLALHALQDLGRPLPVNLKFVIEGEEESQSLGLVHALPTLGKKLSADGLMIVDFGALPDRSPAVTLGARGCVGFEIALQGSKGDLHSGVQGGVAYNPNRALAELLASLWDQNGHVAVPGFYDGVVRSTEAERDHYTYLQTLDSLHKEHGIAAIGGEKGKSLKENNWFLPTIEINGISGGYSGAGVKTVIPSIARAKLTCRLVPNQDPTHVIAKIKAFLQERVVQGMKLAFEEHQGSRAFRCPPGSFLEKAAARAASSATGKTCSAILAGGSIPIAASLMDFTKGVA